jgi:drug/metabolite transporter (DMT)-like permease
MSQRIPPRAALWILNRFCSGYRSESLAGDLIEQFQQGETRPWFWKQVVTAVLVAGNRHIERSLLLPALRLFLRVAIELAVVLTACTLADQSRRTHSFRDMLTPHFMVTIVVLITTVAIALAAAAWASQKRPASPVVNSLIAAFAMIALGFGAFTWASTTRDDPCQSETCFCWDGN